MNEQLQSKPIENNKSNTNWSKARNEQSEITIRVTKATPWKFLVVDEIDEDQCE